MCDPPNLSKRALEQLAAPVCVKLRRMEEIFEKNPEDQYYLVTGVTDTNLTVETLDDAHSSETDSEGSYTVDEVQTINEIKKECLVLSEENDFALVADPLTVKIEAEEVSDPNLVDLTVPDEVIHDKASLGVHSNRPGSESSSRRKVVYQPYMLIEALNTKEKPKFITSTSKVMKLEPWTDDDSTILQFPFIKKQSWLMPSPRDHVKYFEYFIEDHYLNGIAAATNDNAFNKNNGKFENIYLRNWTDVTVAELKIFLGLLLHTGTAKLKYLGEYWKQHRLYSTCFTDYMTPQRFTAIMQFLTIPGYESSIKNQYRMNHPMADHYNSVIESIYYPGRNLCISYNTVDWGDPKSGTIKVAALYKHDGPVMKIIMDSRKTGVTDMEAVMFQLLEDKLDAGHAVYVDSEATRVTPIFATQLLHRDTYCTGMLSDTCPELPKELSSAELSRGVNKSLFSHGLHVGKFVNMVSTSYYLTTEFKKEEKMLYMAWPETYRTLHNMIGENSHHDMCVYWPSEIHKLPIPKRMFIYTLMLGIMSASKLCNIFSNTTYTYHAYRLKVIEYLLPPLPKPQVELSTMTSHRLVKIPKTHIRLAVDKYVHATARRDCKNCRNKQIRNNTIYECEGCDGKPAYCMPCFFEVHKCVQL